MRYISILMVAVMLLLAGASGLEAQEKDEAKEHFLKGKALVEEGAYEKAVVELKASFEMKKVPIVIYNIALCYDEMHQYADAIKYYKMYLDMKEGQDNYLVENIQNRIEVLSQFIGYLDIQVDQAGAEVLIDDKLAGTTPLEKIFIESGNHEVVIRKTGYYDIKEQVTIVSDKVEKRSYTMEKISGAAAAAPETGGAVSAGPGGAEKGAVKGEGEGKPSRKKLAPAPFWGMLGVTLLFTAGAATTGGLAIKDNEALKGMSRSDDYQPVADRRDKLALSTDILIAAAAASAVATLVLGFFTDFKKEKKTAISLVPSPCGGGLFMGIERKF